MEYLRKRFASLLPRRHPSELLSEKKEEKIAVLIEKYRKAEDPEEKKKHLDQIFRQFPKTLFLASVCFAGDDPSVPVYDRTLYASPGAKPLYEENQPVVMNGNPGYKLAKKNNGNRMHLRMLVSKTSSQSWIPLFTDFTKYTPHFGIKTRVALFTIKEVKAMCHQGQGILINPGENALALTAEDLKRIY
ncbi:MAG: SseB family protein [Clostridia bacterium]|nr:SseB family protein [Clostridia bacterium]